MKHVIKLQKKSDVEMIKKEGIQFFSKQDLFMNLPCIYKVIFIIVLHSFVLYFQYTGYFEVLDNV